jgi:tol-pal system protein YbgF
MFRRLLLPCACFIVALGLVAVAMPTLGWGQDRTTQERLDRLERDLNMLLRQVYRGAPPPPAGADGSAGVNTEIRMERLEDRMRDLTGRVEELMNQVNQVRQRVEQINSDVEVRFGQLAAGSGASSPGAPPPHGVLPDGHDVTPAAAPVPRHADDGTLTPPGPPPAELTSTAAPARAPGGGLPGGSAAAQYNHAFGLIKSADYPAAEVALKQFIDHHPKSSLAGSAQYWLGETYYARHRYMEAATAFAEGYKRYPKGAKAPDDLLKLGMALARADQKQNACVAFDKLDHDFPHAAASVRSRATAEKRRLGC